MTTDKNGAETTVTAEKKDQFTIAVDASRSASPTSSTTTASASFITPR